VHRFLHPSVCRNGHSFSPLLLPFSLDSARLLLVPLCPKNGDPVRFRRSSRLYPPSFIFLPLSSFFFCERDRPSSFSTAANSGRFPPFFFPVFRTFAPFFPVTRRQRNHSGGTSPPSVPSQLRHGRVFFFPPLPIRKTSRPPHLFLRIAVPIFSSFFSWEIATDPFFPFLRKRSSPWKQYFFSSHPKQQAKLPVSVTPFSSATMTQKTQTSENSLGQRAVLFLLPFFSITMMPEIGCYPGHSPLSFAKVIGFGIAFFPFPTRFCLQDKCENASDQTPPLRRVKSFLQWAASLLFIRNFECTSAKTFSLASRELFEEQKCVFSPDAPPGLSSPPPGAKADNASLTKEVNSDVLSFPSFCLRSCKSRAPFFFSSREGEAGKLGPFLHRFTSAEAKAPFFPSPLSGRAEVSVSLFFL